MIPSSKNVVRVRTRSERAPVVSKTTPNSHSLIRSPSGSPKSTAGAAEDTFGGKSAHLVNEAVIFLSRALCGEPRGRAIKRRNVLECSAVRDARSAELPWAPFWRLNAALIAGVRCIGRSYRNRTYTMGVRGPCATTTPSSNARMIITQDLAICNRFHQQY